MANQILSRRDFYKAVTESIMAADPVIRAMTPDEIAHWAAHRAAMYESQEAATQIYIHAAKRYQGEANG